MNIFINSYGSSIRVKEGLLSIKREDKIERIPIGSIEKIFLTKSVQLSSDVLMACLENGVDLLITERNGQPVGRLWNNRFGSISTIRKKQLQFSTSLDVTSWIVDQIMTKAMHQAELLMCLLSLDEPDSQLIKDTIDKIGNNSEKLLIFKGEVKDEVAPAIRATEGQIAKLYFKCVNAHLPFRFQFNKRSKHPALDMTNAMLNYAYGILYGNLESSLVKAGLDPFIGFFHRDDYNRPVLTYDVIEVFRPWADWVVFHLCLNEVMDMDMFLVENKVYWMNGDSKRIIIQHFTDFFEEVISYEDKRMTRYNHMDRKATDLAMLIQNINLETL